MEIVLLQVAADNYILEPKDQFRPSFQSVVQWGSVGTRGEAHQELGEGQCGLSVGPSRDLSSISLWAVSGFVPWVPDSSCGKTQGETPELVLLVNSQVSLCPWLHPVLPDRTPT